MIPGLLLQNGDRAKMNFRDHWVTDEDGEQVIFTVEMQRRLSEAGLPVELASLDELPDSETGGSSSRKRDRSRSKTTSEPDFSVPVTIQIDPQTGKYIGRVKWYNVRKGYGFIVRGGGEEIFFHKSGTIDNPNNLQDGQWVLYDVEDTTKGPEATDVETYEGDLTE